MIIKKTQQDSTHDSQKNRKKKKNNMEIQARNSFCFARLLATPPCIATYKKLLCFSKTKTKTKTRERERDTPWYLSEYCSTRTVP